MTAALTAATLDPSGPFTFVLQDVLPRIRNRSAQADLLFLEQWEIAPRSGGGQALRVQQIRRANPELAEAIRTEIAGLRAGHTNRRNE